VPLLSSPWSEPLCSPRSSRPTRSPRPPGRVAATYRLRLGVPLIRARRVHEVKGTPTPPDGCPVPVAPSCCGSA
jgi:hypothetical protein